MAGEGAAESGIFTYGPGNVWYLAAVLWLSKGSIFGVLIMNLLLSSLACVFVYVVTDLLLESRPLATLAALLSAVSITGIEMAPMALSENPFISLFALGNLLFLAGFKRPSIALAGLAGLCLGASILIRPVAQFWPLVILVWAVAIASPFPFRLEFVRQYIGARLPHLALCIGVILICIVGWSARNLEKHDAFALAFSSAGGPANVAALTAGEKLDKPYKEVIAQWLIACDAADGPGVFTIGDRFRCLNVNARQVLRQHSLDLIRVWLELTWVNINEITYLHRLLLPDDGLIGYEYRVKDRRLQYLPFSLALLGIGTLLVLGRFRAMFLLGSWYFYFALLTGFTLYQGSRLMYPAYFAGDIRIAVGVAGPILLFRQLVSKPRSVKSNSDRP